MADEVTIVDAIAAALGSLGAGGALRNWHRQGQESERLASAAKRLEEIERRVRQCETDRSAAEVRTEAGREADKRRDREVTALRDEVRAMQRELGEKLPRLHYIAEQMQQSLQRNNGGNGDR
jgi:type II secretory pathway component PulJ